MCYAAKKGKIVIEGKKPEKMGEVIYIISVI